MPDIWCLDYAESSFERRSFGDYRLGLQLKSFGFGSVGSAEGGEAFGIVFGFFSPRHLLNRGVCF